MNALDLLFDDAFPHGTLDGYAAGCRGGRCPAPVRCRDVHLRYQGDFAFRRQLQSGLSPAAIIEAERRRAAQQRRPALAQPSPQHAQRATAPSSRSMSRTPRPHTRETDLHEQTAAPDARPPARRPITPPRAKPASVPAHPDTSSADRSEARKVPTGPVRVRAQRPPKPTPEPRQLQPCGTLASFARGCPCDACAEANRAYHREYQALRRARGGAGLRYGKLRHGTPSGYQLGCTDRSTCPGSAEGLTCPDAANLADRERSRRRGVPPARPTVDAAPVRRHLVELHAQGLPWTQIAARSQVQLKAIRRVVFGRDTPGRKGEIPAHVDAEKAARIMATTA